MGSSVMKPIESPAEAVKRIKDGGSVMVGGFNYGGVPYTLVDALLEAGTSDLTLIACDNLYDDVGHGKLVSRGRVKKALAAFVGHNKSTRKKYESGELELELMPMGTFTERVRAGGCGLGGILTPTGIGTVVEEGKRIIEAGGRRYILELPIRAEVALIRACRADKMGNLTYVGTNRNFNPIMAMAADVVIAEVDEIVEVGDLPEGEIVTPGLLIDVLTLKGDSDYAART
jgi:acetate CoA/acetoacetate CoA-transferase alpha subunit